MTSENPTYTLWDIVKREIYRYYTHPIYIFGMICAPLFCAFFFLTLMKNGLPTDLPAAVVDMDNSKLSRELIKQLDAFPQTQIIMRTTSFTEARVEMQKGHIYGIFFIPNNFSADATVGKQPVLSFYTNASYFIPASLQFRDMKTISTLANASVGLQQGLAKGYTEDQIMAQLQPIKIDTHALGNPWMNYSVYLSNSILPGLLQLMIFLMTVHSIAMEIKFGTARKWLEMGGNSLTKSLIGKLLPQTIIFTVVGFTFYSLLYGYNYFPLNTGWIPMLIAMFQLVIASQCVGIFMIGVAPTPRMGLSVASLFGILTFSVVGFSFPLSEIHPSIQALANLFPLRHYFLIYIDQALNGRDWFYSWPQYVSLSAFLLIPLLIGANLKKALLYIKYIP
jgi:ABC-2 type transport system permease protein